MKYTIPNLKASFFHAESAYHKRLHQSIKGQPNKTLSLIAPQTHTAERKELGNLFTLFSCNPMEPI